MASSFGLLGDEDEGVEYDEKSGLTGDEEQDAPVVSFSGKKKASKSLKKTAGSLVTGLAFDVIGDEGDSDGEVVDDSEDKSKEDDENEPVIAFTGKKKPSKGGKKEWSVFAAASFDALDDVDEDNDEEKDAFFLNKTETYVCKRHFYPLHPPYAFQNLHQTMY